jgi:hypothetical protein
MKDKANPDGLTNEQAWREKLIGNSLEPMPRVRAPFSQAASSPSAGSYFLPSTQPSKRMRMPESPD